MTSKDGLKTGTKTAWKLVLFAVRDDPELQAFAELYIAGVRDTRQVSAMLEVSEDHAVDLKSRLHGRLTNLRVSIEAGKRLATEISRSSRSQTIG